MSAVEMARSRREIALRRGCSLTEALWCAISLAAVTVDGTGRRATDAELAEGVVRVLIADETARAAQTTANLEAIGVRF